VPSQVSPRAVAAACSAPAVPHRSRDVQSLSHLKKASDLTPEPTDSPTKVSDAVAKLAASTRKLIARSRFADFAERGIAVAMASRLDETLLKVLKTKFAVQDKVMHGLIGEYGALGSMSAKIQLGYILGLYNRFCYDDMAIINQIRNRFAHKVEAHDFSSSVIAGKVQSLKTISHLLAQPNMDFLPNIFEKNSFDIQKNADKYVMTSIILMAVVPELAKDKLLSNLN